MMIFMRNLTLSGLISLSFASANAPAQTSGQSETAAPPAASGIAVLPFESLSPEKENVFLADGVYDGVSTKLRKVANLKVISHNSVAKYRGARNTHEIGRALNVVYVLKGSVRWEYRDDCHSRIHLNAQLIDTRTDAHVWTQEYDRELCDVWALQSEIAQKVADQLLLRSSAK